MQQQTIPAQQQTIPVPVITVDGPSGAGKGSLCKLLAQKLNFHLLDSGALYRVLALAAQQQQISLDDEASLAKVATHLDVQFLMDNQQDKVLLKGEDVSLAIRTEHIGNQSSKISSLPDVRRALIGRQQAFARLPGLVADGRDMGTVIFAQAVAKLFLTASAQERAQRRFLQLQEKGLDANLKNILGDIQARDERDKNRTHSPLMPAADALLIDSTKMSMQAVEQQALAFIRQKI